MRCQDCGQTGNVCQDSDGVWRCHGCSHAAMIRRDTRERERLNRERRAADAVAWIADAETGGLQGVMVLDGTAPIQGGLL